jgi:hypothetical protein
MKHIAVTGRSLKLAAAAGLVLTGALVLPAVTSAGRSNPPSTARVPIAALVEHRSCDHPSPTTHAADVVTVAVPPTAFLRVDGAGRVVAAATNTGCAPRATDDIYLFRTDGGIVRGTSTVLAHRHWHGDFTHAGEYQPQD